MLKITSLGSSAHAKSATHLLWASSSVLETSVDGIASSCNVFESCLYLTEQRQSSFAGHAIERSHPILLLKNSKAPRFSLRGKRRRLNPLALFSFPNPPQMQHSYRDERQAWYHIKLSKPTQSTPSLTHLTSSLPTSSILRM